MSNHNSYWGRKFGSSDLHRGNVFNVRQMTTGLSRSGSNNHGLDTPQSRKDKAKFQLSGIPTLVYNSNRHRVQ